MEQKTKQGECVVKAPLMYEWDIYWGGHGWLNDVVMIAIGPGVIGRVDTDGRHGYGYKVPEEVWIRAEEMYEKEKGYSSETEN